MKRPQIKSPKTIAAIVLAAVVLAAGVFAMLSPGSDAARSTPAASTKPALTITVAKPLPAKLPIRLAANGNIAAWEEAIIGSEANGLRLAELRTNVGDSVKAGQVLAVFAAETVQADLAQTRAALVEAEASAADASGNAARARTLEQTGALSAQQINQYITAEHTAKARVEAARAALAAQQLRLKHTQVVAPDNGVISSRSATVGAVVPAGTELFRMVRQGRLEWRAEVTAEELGRLRTGAPVLVTAANGTEVQGRIRMFAPTVNPQTRSALVYVDLPATTDKTAPIKAGMFAKGEFDLGASEALTVPQQAVVVRDGFSYVFRVNADSRVSQIKVQTGRRLADRVELINGIGPDAQLAVNGAGFLNDGDLVKVVQAGAIQAAGSPAVAK